MVNDKQYRANKFEREKMFKQSERQRQVEKDRLAKGTHKWVLTQHGTKLIKIA